MAGLIKENWLRGRKKHIWFSASRELYHDARRDLRDVDGTEIPTMMLKDIASLDDFEVRAPGIADRYSPWRSNSNLFALGIHRAACSALTIC